MKKNKILLSVLAILLLLIFISFYFAICLKDDYPHIYFPAYIDALFWCLLAAIPISMYCIVFKGYQNIFIKVLLVLVFLSFIFYITTLGLKYYEANSKYTKDYIDAKNIEGISLYALEEIIDNDNPSIIYIGRKDCKECNKSELVINNVLNSEALVIQGYYTNLDREKDSAKHMYDVLNSLNVQAVPSLIFKTGDGKIEKIPIEEAQILKFVKQLEMS